MTILSGRDASPRRPIFEAWLKFRGEFRRTSRRDVLTSVKIVRLAADELLVRERSDVPRFN
jgi:hypothetical protein